MDATLDAAAKQTTELGIRDGSGVQMSAHQRLNLVRFAMENDILANVRKPKENSNGANVKPFDVNAGGRTMANGEAMAAWEVLELLRREQEEKHQLMVELLHLRGWEPPVSGTTFFPPSEKRSSASNKNARRMLERAVPYIKKLTSILGGKHGFTQFIVYMLRAGMPGSGVWRKHRHIDSLVALEQIWGERSLRRQFEALRKRVRILTPTAINAKMRATHCGVEQLKVARMVGSGQVYRYDTLLQARYRAYDYHDSVVPADANLTAPSMEVSPEQKDAALAAAHAHAIRRAAASRSVELQERKLIYDEAKACSQAVWEKAKEDGDGEIDTESCTVEQKSKI